MKKLVSTLNLSRQEWLNYRRRGIGGSDAAAVAGLNPYSSSIKVYYDKISQISDISDNEDNEAMRQGRDLEEYVARRFTEETGLKVRRANYIFYDEQRPYMIADVDRMIVGGNAGLECKTVSPYSESKWDDGDIPIHYQLQCYHYMSILGVKEWYIAALVFGRDFIIRKLEWDDGIINHLRQIEKDFWENYVCKRVLPPPDGSPLTSRLIEETFGCSNGERIVLDGFGEKLSRREEIMA